MKQLGISWKETLIFDETCSGGLHKGKFALVRMNLEDRKALSLLFEQASVYVECNLATQAEIQYSLEHPETYMTVKLSDS